MSSPRQGFMPYGYPSVCLSGYMVSGSFHGELLSFHKTTIVSLTHRKARKTRTRGWVVWDVPESAVWSTAAPCHGGMTSKGGLCPSRPCEPACDVASDSATIRRLRLGVKRPLTTTKKGCDGALASRPSRTPVGKQGSVVQARLRNGDLCSSPGRCTPDGRRDSVCVRRCRDRQRTPPVATAR